MSGPGDSATADEETMTVSDHRRHRRAESPATEEEIDALRREIDRLDAEILELDQAAQRRVSQRIGAARMAAGGPRIVYSREMAVLDRFADLGPEGRDLAHDAAAARPRPARRPRRGRRTRRPRPDGP